MINVDDRVLSKADEKELFLLLHIAKFMNKENFAFPSINTLAKSTRWEERKVRRVKDSCVAKGLLSVTKRHRENGGRTSDGYTILTNSISVFVNLQGKGTPQNGEGGTPQNGEGGTPQNGEGKEVLTSESLTIELVKNIVSFLNETTGSFYKHTSKSTQRMIKARLSEGYALDDFKSVIRFKAKDWEGTEFSKYLRPSTLFRATNFENYLQELNKKKQSPRPHATPPAPALPAVDREATKARLAEMQAAGKWGNF